MRRTFHDVNQQKFVQKENSKYRKKNNDVHERPGYRFSPKKNHLRTYVCVSGSKRCYFFGKWMMPMYLENNTQNYVRESD